MTYRDPYRLNMNVRRTSPAAAMAERTARLSKTQVTVRILGERQVLRAYRYQRRLAGDVWQRIVCMHTAGPAYRARQIARKRRGRKH